jgi:acyl-CoA thioesterase I
MGDKERLLYQFSLVFLLALSSSHAIGQQTKSRSDVADRDKYLAPVSKALLKDWPHNRSVNIVCHGHSVPAGYFVTPEVRSLEAYPHLLRVGLAERYPHAVINVIVTAIGGEDSESGAARFRDDVLKHHPDVVTLDYGLNDRNIGLARARKSWRRMIEEAQAQNVKVILLTPTVDLKARLDDPDDPLYQHAEQIRNLARQYQTGLVDSLAAFQNFADSGGKLADLMSQSNHPNAAGHKLVAEQLLEWFPQDETTPQQQRDSGKPAVNSP